MATKKSEAGQAIVPDIYVSRSEKKRQAKNIEEIAKELVDLSAADLRLLPCPEYIKEEIKVSKGLTGGALKRQTKYIAKELRDIPTDEILDFLAQRKGSRLKEANAFHELEHLREEIITEAITAWDEARQEGERLDEGWESETIAAASTRFDNLDSASLKKSALRYAATRKPAHRRELFRLLQAAHERQQFALKAQKSST
ncbi:MAG: ribosome biogenesis factor YjgA [Thermodesulfobacteriota bacterium]